MSPSGVLVLLFNTAAVNATTLRMDDYAVDNLVFGSANTLVRLTPLVSPTRLRVKTPNDLSSADLSGTGHFISLPTMQQRRSDR